MVLEDAGELGTMTDDVGEEKSPEFVQFPLVAMIFVFSPFPQGARNCDVAVNIVGFVWMLRWSYVVVSL